MLKVFYSNQFKRDLKSIQKRGYNTKLMDEVIFKLMKQETLDSKYQVHPLKGKYSGYTGCHVTPDWILIYKHEKDILVLTMTRTGTHSDLY